MDKDMVKLAIVTLILGYFAAGCGRITVDPAIEPYIKRFELDAAAQGRQANTAGIAAEFSSLAAYMSGPLHAAGLCENSDHITIDPAVWSHLTDASKELLIYHELGHCVLGRAHVTAKIDAVMPLLTHVYVAERPLSIMYPELFDPSIYIAFRANYIRELFE